MNVKEEQEYIDEEGFAFVMDKGYQQRTRWSGIDNTNQRLVFDEIHS